LHVLEPGDLWSRAAPGQDFAIQARREGLHRRKTGKVALCGIRPGSGALLRCCLRPKPKALVDQQRTPAEEGHRWLGQPPEGHGPRRTGRRVLYTNLAFNLLLVDRCRIPKRPASPSTTLTPAGRVLRLASGSSGRSRISLLQHRSRRSGTGAMPPGSLRSTSI